MDRNQINQIIEDEIDVMSEHRPWMALQPEGWHCNEGLVERVIAIARTRVAVILSLEIKAVDSEAIVLAAVRTAVKSLDELKPTAGTLH